MGEHVQTMGRQVSTVVSPDVIASVIAVAIVISSWWDEWETGAGQ
jgi:hypothetical protein